MVSFSLRQRLLFRPSQDIRPVSFHLSQFALNTLPECGMAGRRGLCQVGWRHMDAIATMVAFFAGALTPQGAWGERAAWREAPAVELRGVDGAEVAGATVRALWNEGWIFFEFSCRDEGIVSPGTRDGLDHFKIGDVVEIFLAREGVEPYAEIHATPAGRKTVYFFNGCRELAPAPAAAQDVRVRSESTADGWRAVMSIPWALVGGSPRNAERGMRKAESGGQGTGDRGRKSEGGEGGAWQVLAGRYDYAAEGGVPVLSSFPGQRGVPDFHARSRYARLELRR